MAPEQMQSAREVDARTDIWALGAILYELLTGKSPFDGETLPEVYVRISTQAPPPLRDRRPDLPLGIEQVILKCLEKDRNLRYQNVAELAVALAPFGPKRTPGVGRAGFPDHSRRWIVGERSGSAARFGGPARWRNQRLVGPYGSDLRQEDLARTAGCPGPRSGSWRSRSCWWCGPSSPTRARPVAASSFQPSAAPSVTDRAPAVPSLLPEPPPEVASAAASQPPVLAAAPKGNRDVWPPKQASARPVASSAPPTSSRAVAPAAKTRARQSMGRSPVRLGRAAGLSSRSR